MFEYLHELPEDTKIINSPFNIARMIYTQVQNTDIYSKYWTLPQWSNQAIMYTCTMEDKQTFGNSAVFYVLGVIKFTIKAASFAMSQLL